MIEYCFLISVAMPWWTPSPMRTPNGQDQYQPGQCRSSSRWLWQPRFPDFFLKDICAAGTWNLRCGKDADFNFLKRCYLLCVASLAPTLVDS